MYFKFKLFDDFYLTKNKDFTINHIICTSETKPKTFFKTITKNSRFKLYW